MSDPSFQPPGPTSSHSNGRGLAIAGAAIVALIVIVAAIVFLGGDDGSNELAGDVDGVGERTDTRGRDDRSSGRGTTEDEPDAPGDSDPDTTTTEPQDNCATAGEILDRDALPTPDTSATPIELQINRAGRGTEYPFTFDGDGWPYVGELFVSVTPGTYTDVPIHLEPGEQAVIFAANDCIKGTVEIYSPSGEQIGVTTDLGEPGVVEGWEFTGEDVVADSGTHVFRVIQDTGTDAGGFVLRFYAPAA